MRESPPGWVDFRSIYLSKYIDGGFLRNNQVRSNMTKRASRLALMLIGIIGIGSSALQAACPGGVSTSFTASGDVTNRAVFNLHKLRQFSPTQANVTYFAAGSVVTESFTGVLL